MLYLSTDLHSKQLTVNLRGEDGEVMIRRQVSTRAEEPRKFLEEVRRLAGPDGYVAILEVCGFLDWFAELLPQCGCREVVLIQAEYQSRRKTDRRDADQLGELLWVNRHRLLAGQKVKGLRRVVPPTPPQRDDRRLTQARRNNGAERTRVINGAKHILRRLNIAQHCPTKGIQTKTANKWLKTVPLSEFDRLEMNQLLARWELLEKQGERLDEQIAQRALADSQATLLRSVPGLGLFMSLGFSSRIGDIGRFATPRSLANYWGLTPSCKNSGETTKRLGSITKAGSALARFLLGQLVLQVLKKDTSLRKWYRGIKRRRGSKIARVAVMRRLTVIFWHMLTYHRPYDLAAAAKSKPTPRRAIQPTAPAEQAESQLSAPAEQAPLKSAVPLAACVPSASHEPALGALPPNPRDLSLGAPLEGSGGRHTAKPSPQSKPQPSPQSKQPSKCKPVARAKTSSRVKAGQRSPLPTGERTKSKADRRPKPPALRPEPGSGAQVASRQSPILPSG